MQTQTHQLDTQAEAGFERIARSTGLTQAQPSTQAQPQEFYYHVPWRTRSVHVGSHKTSMRGAGSDFSAFVPLMNCPDPKRLDIRASMRTIPKQMMVRTFFERNAIKVYAVTDMSGSMQFQGAVEKNALQTQVVEAVAWSALRQGDAFGMLACSNQALPHLSILPTYRKTAVQEARQKLTDYWRTTDATAQGAMGLPESAKGLGAQRALVFLISDFHFSETLIDETFKALRMHDVVPVVLWDEEEFERLPTWGWARVREMEIGLQRSLFMRPSLHQSIKAFAQARKQSLIALSQAHGARMPFFVTNQLDVTALSSHLMGG